MLIINGVDQSALLAEQSALVITLLPDGSVKVEPHTCPSGYGG